MNMHVIKNYLLKTIIYAVLVFYSIFTLLPLYWSVITSLKTAVELSEIPPTLIPINPTGYFYVDLFKMRHFGELIRNSIIVGSGNAVFSTIIGTFLGLSLIHI